MAVPKKRTTRAVQGQRRSHDALVAPNPTVCSNCAKPVRPHSICQACGVYRGKKLLTV